MLNHYTNYQLPAYCERNLFTQEFFEASKHVMRFLNAPDVKKAPLLREPLMGSFNPLVPTLSCINQNTSALIYARYMTHVAAITLTREVMIPANNRATFDMKIDARQTNNKHYKMFKEMVEGYLFANRMHTPSREFEAALYLIDYFRGHHSRYSISVPQLVGTGCTISIIIACVDGHFNVQINLAALLIF